MIGLWDAHEWLLSRGLTVHFGSTGASRAACKRSVGVATPAEIGEAIQSSAGDVTTTASVSRLTVLPTVTRPFECFALSGIDHRVGVI